MVIYDGLSFFLAVPYVAMMTITQQQICHRTFQEGRRYQRACIHLFWDPMNFFPNINPNIFRTIFASHVEAATFRYQHIKI